jgi:phosphate transport system permease protein
LKYGADSVEHARAAEQYESVKKELSEQRRDITNRINDLKEENDRFKLRVQTADGKMQDVSVAEIVRAYPANRLSFAQKLGVYGSRWWEFLSDDPRESNSEGGVFPAIWGTVAMTLLMCVAVVPLGVLAALYLREYAKFGPMISAVRIAMNNLAGVPSIVFGVFGLGFFCYFLGGHIDNWFYAAEKSDHPHFGTGGLLWASLTMALLTLPVVIVTTEEALAAVANSLREGSYACGASKWQTIWRIVLPRAMPGVLTGTILAMSRGAGEVAPLMLVGVVKLAPALPIDSVFPYVHAERSFMHLGFHIFDVGFQSQDAEAGKPMVYTTTLLLIVIIVALNLTAILVRARLRRRHAGGSMQ